MVISEIVAKVKKKKINPTGQANPGKITMRQHFIPFTNLNLAYAFGILIRVLLDVIVTTKLGFPKISIHLTIMLFCLLLCNPAAKAHLKRRFEAWRGLDMTANKKQIQPLAIWTTENHRERQNEQNMFQNEASMVVISLESEPNKK